MFTGGFKSPEFKGRYPDMGWYYSEDAINASRAITKMSVELGGR